MKHPDDELSKETLKRIRRAEQTVIPLPIPSKS